MVNVDILPFPNVVVLFQSGKIDLEVNHIAGQRQENGHKYEGSGEVVVKSWLQIARKDKTKQVAPNYKLKKS